MAAPLLGRSLGGFASPSLSRYTSSFQQDMAWRSFLRCTCSLVLAEKSPADLCSVAAAQRFELPEKENAKYICCASGTVGKDVLPRLGGLLDVQPVTDIVEIKGPDVFVRPIYAGNAMQTLRATGDPKVVTFRPSAFAPSALGDAECPLEDVVSFEGETQVVISGGRGIRTKEDFEMLLEPLGKKLGAALGATRALVDMGVVPNDFQVGQTGKIVAPNLYIAVGLSGAVQHLAGMRGSKVVVAVNKDPDAPIFRISDYYLVGDIYKIIPELTEKLKQQ